MRLVRQGSNSPRLKGMKKPLEYKQTLRTADALRQLARSQTRDDDMPKGLNESDFQMWLWRRA